MSRDYQALCEAIDSADLRKVDALILNGIDVNTADSEGLSPLRLSIERANPEIVNRLVVGGADVNEMDDSGWTPLMHAIDLESDAAWQSSYQTGCESTELTQLLLASGAQPTKEALQLASEYDNQKAVMLLREYIDRAS